LALHPPLQREILGASVFFRIVHLCNKRLYSVSSSWNTFWYPLIITLVALVINNSETLPRPLSEYGIWEKTDIKQRIFLSCWTYELLSCWRWNFWSQYEITSFMLHRISSLMCPLKLLNCSWFAYFKSPEMDQRCLRYSNGFALHFQSIRLILYYELLSLYRVCTCVCMCMW
jgi:hypothetical protein